MAKCISFAPDRKEEIFSILIKALRSGQVVAIPTETYYGLAVDPFEEQALERLFRLKRRPASKPVPVIIGKREQLTLLVQKISESHRLLIERFWPGPLTLLFWAKPGLPDLLTGKAKKVAVRLTSHPLAQELAAVFGPLTATSANLSGASPAVKAEEVLRELPDVDLVLDAGVCPGKVPSTLLDLTVDPPQILREGRVTKDELCTFLPQIALEKRKCPRP